MTRNPILKWRQEKGLTREGLAVLLGISYWALARLECGHRETIKPEIAKRLKEIGYPGDPNRDYCAWREELREELKEKVRRVLQAKNEKP